MLSKSKIKFIRSLRSKKQRNDLRLFIAEGQKTVDDLLLYFPCSMLFHTSEYCTSHSVSYLQEVTPEELKQISFLEEPQQVLGVFVMPEPIWSNDYLVGELIIALDMIQDPGNLGTILRVADWFGIKHIVCARGTVDVFNPKTIQATMGAIGRVHVYIVDMGEFLQQLPHKIPVYGTFLEGENIYSTNVQNEAVIIMGNEGNGISQAIEKHVTHRITIPSFPPNQSTSESLNVAMATAIVCAEFRRRLF